MPSPDTQEKMPTGKPQISIQTGYSEVENISKIYNLKRIFHKRNNANVLYQLIGITPNRRVIAQEIGTFKRSTFSNADTLSISKYEIILQNGDRWNVSKSLDILYQRFGGQTATYYDIDELMLLMCPEYDVAHFKPYHAKRIIKWYNILILSYLKGLEGAKEQSKKKA